MRGTSRNVPGRKTDVNDAEWLADLVRHGLVRGSYVPDRAQRELRELTRYRTELLEERTAHVNRLQKTLETANIKLGAVATDVLGVSGRAILAALVDPDAGRDRRRAGRLARGRLRTKIPELQRALIGRLRPHHRFMLAELLVMIDALDERIDAVSAEIAERTRPFADDLARLDTIPGIGQRVAEIVVAELGPDLSPLPLPRAARLVGWAVSWQPRECRQAQDRQDPLGQRRPPPRPRRGRPRRQSLPHLSPRAVLPAQTTDVAPSEPPSPSPTRSSASSTSSSPARPTTSTSAPTTSTAVTRLLPSASSSVASNASAIRSPSRRSHDSTLGLFSGQLAKDLTRTSGERL